MSTLSPRYTDGFESAHFSMASLSSSNTADISLDGLNAVQTQTPRNEEVPIDSSPLNLDSFLPLLQVLPQAFLDGQTYYIKGIISEVDRQAFLTLARRVEEFTLSDLATGVKIAPSVFLQLAILSERDEPLFPSLSRLRVVDADESLSTLPIFLTPSLQAVHATNVPNAYQTAFSCFLETLTEVAPGLSELKLYGRFSSDSLESIVRFIDLRCLELHGVVDDLKFGEFIRRIGNLRRLESFVINTRPFDGQTNVSSTHGSGTPAFPESDDVPNLKLAGFHALSKLHITAPLSFMQDLLHYIDSPAIRDLAMVLTKAWGQSADFQQGEQCKICNNTMSTEDPKPVSTKRGRGGGGSIMQVPEYCRDACIGEKEIGQFTFLLERFIPPAWEGEQLRSVEVGQITDNHGRPYALPGDILRQLLFHRSLQSLNIWGWTLCAVDSVLGLHDQKPRRPSMQAFRLPVSNVNPGISLSTMRLMAETYPNLRFLECRVNSLVDVPTYSSPSGQAISHGMEVLSMGNEIPLPDLMDLLPVARHLYLLFPNLQEMKTHNGENERQWSYVGELIKMCQMARAEDSTRLPPDSIKNK